MTKHSILPIVVILSTLAACGGGNAPPPAPKPDVIGVLKTRPSLLRFTEALEATGVASALLSSGAYTVFAPMDKGVAGPLDEATVRHHILPTRVAFSDMAGENTSYDTLNNDQIEIDVTDQIAIGSALMVESDIAAANGIIHVIDRVQTPDGGSPIEQEPLDQVLDSEAVNTN
ncbi:MAG: fasciclin domain-containing protein [Alphaproteobacteria bacterium]|nr:fasciclin domain-containing protein [Alphaproteobacteria bacterium]